MKHNDITPDLKADDDSRLREILKKELPEPHRNEWFTRKVLNRLPESRPVQKRYYLIEYVAYAVALWICIALWIVLFTQTDTSALTVRSLLHYAVLSTFTVGIITTATLRTVLRD